MTANELLQQLLVMVDATDFNRCTSARAFKGQYDVWVHKHAETLRGLQPKPEPVVEESVTASDGPVLVPVEKFLEESTEPGGSN